MVCSPTSKLGEVISNDLQQNSFAYDDKCLKLLCYGGCIHVVIAAVGDVHAVAVVVVFVVVAIVAVVGAALGAAVVVVLYVTVVVATVAVAVAVARVFAVVTAVQY